jgi:hypothetical protein
MEIETSLRVVWVFIVPRVQPITGLQRQPQFRVMGIPTAYEAWNTSRRTDTIITMSSRIIFTTAPFHVDDIPLGSFVPDVRYPHQDALPSKALPSEAFSKRSQKSFSGIMDSDKQKSFRIQLIKLVNFTAKGSNSENFTLRADRGWIYELRQPKALFKELCSTDEVRRWLREGLESSQNSYFVVGLRTFENAVVGKAIKSTKGMDVVGPPPTSLGIRRNTGIDPGEATAENTRTGNAEESFETDGELVYAVEYRNIIMKKRQPDAPKLDSDNIWRYYSDTRVVVGEDRPFEEYEAILGDEDIEIDGPHEPLTDTDGETILLPITS